MRSAEAQRAYNEGYKQALLDALAQKEACRTGLVPDVRRATLGGPNSRFLPRGVPGSIYNDR